MMVESDIVRGLQAGENSAYKYLYQHYYNMLCTMACEFVHDTMVSEMIVSDVIFAIWKNRTSLEINSSLRNYLVRSVRNRCLNYRAQTERRQTLPIDMDKLNEIEQSCDTDSAANPLTQLIEKELDKKINESIETLPDQTRKIFCLSRFDNKKYGEIAQQLGVSVDVVKYHIKSALAQLRVMLKDYLILLSALIFVFHR